ncbi:hypothetical protein DFQ28_005699 [Apophysomyces sp. BC1034]|nr:hypothetical protein DFQ29_002104 [Apophysomyces sp. BC1021]KAG0187885.1 hypothetical protein DFQ28_005699 [Apophysomyces sp. BC1034]
MPPPAVWRNSFTRWKANRYLKRVGPVAVDRPQSATGKMSLKQQALNYINHIVTRPCPAIIAPLPPPPPLSASTTSPSQLSETCPSMSHGSFESATTSQKEKSAALPPEKGDGTDSSESDSISSSSSISIRSISNATAEDDDGGGFPQLERVVSPQSQTLSKIPTLERIHRALPPLPDDNASFSSSSSSSLSSSSVHSSPNLFINNTVAGPSSLPKTRTGHSKIRLQRAATWLGRPLQKLLSSPQLHHVGRMISSTSAKLIAQDKPFDEADVSKWFSSSNSLSCEDTTTPPAEVQDPDTKRDIREPFGLNFLVSARPTRRSLAMSFIQLWPGRRKSKTGPAGSDTMQIVGLTPFISSDSLGHLENKSVYSYKIRSQNEKQAKELDIELTVEFEVQRESMPLLVKYPWANLEKQPRLANATEEGYDDGDDDAGSDDYDNDYDNDDDGKGSQIDPEVLTRAIQHCQQGDYLTIYVRGLGFPVWKRYWATLCDHHLVLRDFSYKDKAPLCMIPLGPLQSVSKPTEEDRENVCIEAKQGLVLRFDRTKAMIVEPVRLEEDEGFDGKMYLFADGFKHSLDWRRALQSHVHKSLDTLPQNENGVDVRFLW